MTTLRWEWIATASEAPSGGLAFRGYAHRAMAAALNGVYTSAACGAVVMAVAANPSLPRCPRCAVAEPRETSKTPGRHQSEAGGAAVNIT